MLSMAIFLHLQIETACDPELMLENGPLWKSAGFILELAHTLC